MVVSKKKIWILLGVFLTLFVNTSIASAACDTNAKLDWTDNPWLPGQMSNNYIVSGKNLNFQVFDPVNSLITFVLPPPNPPIPLPVSAVFYQGSQAVPDDSLLFSVELDEIGTNNTLTVDIELGIAGIGLDQVSFELFDVDGEVGGFERKEKFVVTGYLDGVEVLPALNGSAIHTINGNEVLGNAPASSIGGNTSDGVVGVSFPSHVDRVVIEFNINPGSIINPGSQPGFGLYDIEFCYDTIAPAQPLNPPVLQTASDNGLFDNDNIISVIPSTFDVFCTEENSVLTLYSNLNNSGQYFCSSVGLASITTPEPPPAPLGTYDGIYELFYTETDYEGNESLPSPSVFVTLDSIPPVISEIRQVGKAFLGDKIFYEFASNEEGIVSFGGSCLASDVAVVVGNNLVELSILGVGVYQDCFITVIDVAGNVSDVLVISEFEVARRLSSGGGSGSINVEIKPVFTKLEVLEDDVLEDESCLKYDNERGLRFSDADNLNDLNDISKYYLIDSKGGRQYIVSGYGNYLYGNEETDLGLGNDITRLEWAKVLMVSRCWEIKDNRSIEYTYDGRKIEDFKDLPREIHVDEKTKKLMDIAYSALYYGLIDGTEEGNAEIGREINVAEFIKMLTRAERITSFDINKNLQNKYLDSMSSDNWYMSYVYKLNSLGVYSDFLNGVIFLSDSVKRGEAFRIAIKNFIKFTR